MKRIKVVFILLFLFAVVGCNNVNKQIDKETRSNLENIYNKSDSKESFNKWLKQFDNYTISYSDEYTYIIGSVDTNINIFSYESFEIVNDYWIVDSINTNVKLYEPSNKNNLNIEYGDNGHWLINSHDTNIEIIYRDLTVSFNLNGVSINETIEESKIVRECNSITLPTITSNKYTFKGWAIDNNPNNIISNDLKVIANYNLYAIWEHPYLELEYASNGEYTIKGLKKSVEVVDIPELFNGINITSISSSFLSSNSNDVLKINIPKTITKVDNNTFNGIYNKELVIDNISQTNSWDSNWRDNSYLNVSYVTGGKDTYYSSDEKANIPITNYLKESSLGNIPKVTTTDSDFNRVIYYWSKNVTSTQKFTDEGAVINITKGDILSNYILQVNDLKGTMPLTVGLKYTISFKIKSSKANAMISVVLYKNNNSVEYYHKEYGLSANTFQTITAEFTAEDAYLFFKIYLGKTEAEYTVKDFTISYNYIDYIESEINKTIPKSIYSSFELPSFNDNELNVKYNTSVSSIENNEFIYNDPSGKEKVTLSSIINYNGKTYYHEYNSVIKSPEEKIPEIRITLSNSNTISDTDDYTQMILNFIEFDKDSNSTYTLNEVSGGIRIRGNSTRTFPKKAYRIKFDSKQSFFGLPKAKSWVLLANHADQSLMRAYLAYNLGQKFDNMDFAPSAYYVDLYVNDVYYGNYILTEQMQVGKGRVDIDSDAGITDTGYLLEYDMHIEGVDGVDYFRLNGENSVYFIKSPDRSDGLTDSQFNYIKDYITRVDTAIRTRNGYEELIDVDSFVDFFIMQEIFKNIDCNQGSIYMYKEEESKLKMGPIWDFDLSAGNDSQDLSAVRTDGWFSFAYYKNQWMYNLMKDPKVANKFVERWHEMYEYILEMVESVYDIYDYIEDSALRNFEVDDVIGKEKTWYTVDEVYNIKTYKGQVDYLYNWLTERVEWINNNIDSL